MKMLEKQKTTCREAEKIAALLQGNPADVDSEEIALMGDKERERAIADQLYGAGTSEVVYRGQQHIAKLFFIPVIFPASRATSGLTGKYAGAAVLTKALSQAGLGGPQQSVRLVSRLFSHGEVATWSTGQLSKMLHWILAKHENSTHTPGKKSEPELKPLPLLSYLVGVVYAPSPVEPTLFLDDWHRPAAIARSTLGMQDATSRDMLVPTVLAPQEYTEALIQGMTAGVKVMAKQMAQIEDVDHKTGEYELTDDANGLPVTLDVTCESKGEWTLEIMSQAMHANFNLDLHRLGRTGVGRIVEAAYQAAGCFDSSASVN
jgi:hypothetical protein